MILIYLLVFGIFLCYFFLGDVVLNGFVGADLEPPAPRPATTARVAQRMIAGALSRQGISSQNLRAKTKANAEQALAQEAERKQRLLNRQQLRDEAWGDD